jgi:hypothetical protein
MKIALWMIALSMIALATTACSSSHASDDAGATTDCDPEHALCDQPAPPCPAGFAPSVESGCWGPCVMNLECAPIPCDPEGSTSECPSGWGCVSEGECRQPR